MTEVNLHRLLVKAQMASTEYYRDLWFRGCTLSRNQLFCPDTKTAECVARLFLPQLRNVISDLEVRVEGRSAPVTAHWKTPAASHGDRRVFNRRATDREPEDQENDLLD